MVEWKKLGELCRIRTGKLNANAQEENGIYPFFTCDVNPYKINSYAFDCEALILAGNGNIGSVKHYIGKFNAYQRTYVLSEFEKINARFLYHHLNCFFKSYIEIKLRKGSVPYITLPLLTEYFIPIPSLQEQEGIVGILDTFTASIDNLKAQIEQRRKQYEGYLDKFYYSKQEMMDLANKGDIQIKTLDEIGTFTRGRRFVRTDIVSEGVPCIHYGDMYTYYGVKADTTPSFLTEETSKKLRFAQKGDVVIVGAGENDIDIGVGVAWMGKEDVVVHDACYIFKHSMNPIYLSYFMRSNNYHQQIRMGVVDGKICSISAKELGRTLIPLPSLQEQDRIVGILDTFTESIANLEAQLEQRQKQYEYYREKLLTFE